MKISNGALMNIKQQQINFKFKRDPASTDVDTERLGNAIGTELHNVAEVIDGCILDNNKKDKSKTANPDHKFDKGLAEGATATTAVFATGLGVKQAAANKFSSVTFGELSKRVSGVSGVIEKRLVPVAGRLAGNVAHGSFHLLSFMGKIGGALVLLFGIVYAAMKALDTGKS